MLESNEKQLFSSQTKMEKVNIPPDLNVTIFSHSPWPAHQNQVCCYAAHSEDCFRVLPREHNIYELCLLKYHCGNGTFTFNVKGLSSSVSIGILVLVTHVFTWGLLQEWTIESLWYESFLKVTNLLSFWVIVPFSSFLTVVASTLFASLAKSKSRTSDSGTDTMANASLSSFVWQVPICNVVGFCPFRWVVSF